MADFKTEWAWRPRSATSILGELTGFLWASLYRT